MGWNNPDVPWSTLEAVLSGRNGGSLSGGPEADGGDSPAWSRKRDRYQPPPLPEPGERVPYAELHCHSNFSFLDGASPPEELVEEAKRLGLDALALTDHDGMYGVVRFAEAAAELDVATVFGTELSLGLSAPQNGVADPEGTHLLLLARDPEGYRALCRTVSAAQLRGEEKGRPVYDLDELVARTAGHVLALTGCRKGAVRHALATGGPAATGARFDGCASGSGRDHVVVELSDPATRRHRAQRRAGRARRRRRAAHIATSASHYAAPDRARWPRRWPRCAPGAASTSSTAGSRLPGTAHLRSGAEMAARFARYPGAVARAAALGRECAFDLALVAPNLPAVPGAARARPSDVAARAHLARRGRAGTAATTEYPEAYAPDRARAGDHRGDRTSPATS